MPRPSMAAQRKEEILDALEQCILQDSLESTSLEKLAEQAKMKRSILRHYIGNRDDIIVALSERYLAIYDAQWQQTIEWLPDEENPTLNDHSETSPRLTTLMDILFGERDQEYINKSIIADAIYAQAKRLEAVREHQLQSMNQSIELISQELSKAYPEADSDKIELVSRGILAAYLHSESLLPFGSTTEISKLKQVSLLLLNLLKEPELGLRVSGIR